MQLHLADTQLIFPSCSDRCPPISANQIYPIVGPIRIRKNKLIAKRIQDKSKDRLAAVKTLASGVAVTVTRLSSTGQQMGPTEATPGTPATPEEVLDVRELLALNGTKRRGRPPTKAAVKTESINMSVPTSRLESIKGNSSH